MFKIAIFEDDEMIRKMILGKLKGLFPRVEFLVFENADTVTPKKLRKKNISAVIADFNMGIFSGIDLFMKLRRSNLKMPFILYSSCKDTVRAVQEKDKSILDRPDILINNYKDIYSYKNFEAIHKFDTDILIERVYELVNDYNNSFEPSHCAKYLDMNLSPYAVDKLIPHDLGRFFG